MGMANSYNDFYFYFYFFNEIIQNVKLN